MKTLLQGVALVYSMPNKIDYLGISAVIAVLFAGVSLLLNPNTATESSMILSSVAGAYAGNSIPKRKDE